MIWKNDEETLMIELGDGDVSMGTAKRSDKAFSDELIFYSGPKGEIGREDKDNIGKSSTELKPPCRIVFHRIESLDVLIERLSFLRKEMAIGLGVS